MQYPIFALKSVRFATQSVVSTYAKLQSVDASIRPVVKAYALLTWRVVSSRQAIAVYRFLWRLFLAIGALLIYASFTLGQSLREACDRLVEESLQPLPQSEQAPPAQPSQNPTVAEIDPWDAPIPPAPHVAIALPPTPFATLPPAQIEPAIEPTPVDKKKRGRPRKKAV